MLGSGFKGLMRPYHGKFNSTGSKSILHFMSTLDIFNTCFSFSPPHPSTHIMCTCQQLKMCHHLESGTAPNSGHTSRMRLALWMVATFIALPLHWNSLPIETTKLFIWMLIRSFIHLFLNWLGGVRDQCTGL